MKPYIYVNISATLDACVYQLTTKFHVKSTRCGHTSAASTDCLPNAGPTASTCGPMPWEPSSHLGILKVCLGFPRIHRNIEEKYLFLIFENSEKNKTLICEKHYLIIKLKTKIYVIPRSRFKLNDKHIIFIHFTCIAHIYICIVQYLLINVT